MQEGHRQTEDAQRRRAPDRIDGYAPIADYAAIGDGRTVALISRDGSVDWLPLPNLDSPTIFAACLDSERGGRFALTPEVPYVTERRYLPGTNVLETTFFTDSGVARVTDAMMLPDAGLAPFRELVRKVEGLSGRVPLRWSVEARFDYGRSKVRVRRHAGVPVVAAGSGAVALSAFEAGDPECSADAITGSFEARAGTSGLLALSVAHQEPLVVPVRHEVERRLVEAAAAWRRWTGQRIYEGPWQEPVLRSILALKLLVFAPSGAVAAAATTSLPEEIGGERNWDYRFSWVRDSAFTLAAFLELGCTREAPAYFWWLLHASELSRPAPQVLYRLDGGARAAERTVPLDGYRRSQPVRIGNAAVDQIQLDTYGELLQTAWIFACSGHRIDADVGVRLAEIADLVCTVWQRTDSGIWEARSEPVHFTHSKMMCWIALDRALSLAERGLLPSKNSPRWQAERAAIEDFVETRCWSSAKESYVRFAGSEELDASLLLGVLFGYGESSQARLATTVDAVRRELGQGPFVHRYLGDDGVAGSQGAFLACSFWLAEALARTGRRGEAADLLDALVELANDVGLYSEEIDPATGELLGNFPQALSHLALISAAIAIQKVSRR